MPALHYLPLTWQARVPALYYLQYFVAGTRACNQQARARAALFTVDVAGALALYSVQQPRVPAASVPATKCCK